MVLSLFPERAPLAGAPPRLALVAARVTPTNRRLLEALADAGADARFVHPAGAARLRAGDLALGRLDVLPGLDGVEPGLDALRRLEERGVRVLNGAGALLAAHDKLATALRLAARGLPHPRTAHVGEGCEPDLDPPVVVKPRFGSWGRDVVLCASRRALRRTLGRLRHRSWFRRQGALVQELVEPQGRDLRLLVARGEVAGAIARVAAPGEWRTNVALGGERHGTTPPPGAEALALEAAGAIGADLVGVDLLPDGQGGYVVIELNGAVDFTEHYSLDGEDVFEQVARCLLRARYPRADAEETHWEAARQAARAGT